MDDFEAHGPFYLSPVLYDKLPLLHHEVTDTLGPFAPVDFDAPGLQIDAVLGLLRGAQFDLDLPQLDKLDLVEGDQSTPSDSSVFSAEPSAQSEEPHDDVFDVWISIMNGESQSASRQLCSWEAFDQPSHEELASAYLFEAGPEGFDAALQSSEYVQIGHAIQSEPLLQAVLALGMGRSSLFFSWDTGEREFKQVVEKIRIPGCSLETSQALLAEVIQAGNHFKHLQTFVDQAYRSSSTFSGMVALARAVESVLSTVEVHLAHESLQVRGFLHLAATFQRPVELLTRMAAFIRHVANASTNVELASMAFDQMWKIEESPCSAPGIFHEIFSCVARPFLDTLNRLVGLEHQPPEYDSTDDSLDLPSFIDGDTASTIHGIRESLLLLRIHQPGHVLCSPNMRQLRMPSLKVEFDWLGINRVMQQAVDYEHRLQAALSTSRNQHALAVDHGISKSLTEHGGRDYDWTVFAQQLEMGEPLSASPCFAVSPDLLEQATIALCQPENRTDDASYITPDLSLCPALSLSPILAVQSKLVNFAVLRLVFQSNHLRAHLRLQHNFQLLGSGLFVTQLMSALLDPSRSTAERRKGIMRTNELLGLRLGSRKTWPPASSELQLALMGILSDCFHTSSLAREFHAGDTPPGKEHGELPGKLSFSVRSLSPEEAEKCMDASSINALDFLRLQYTATSPINAVITTQSLEKYDAVFKAALRLQRTLYVVVHLPLTSQRGEAASLRCEIQHFVISCAEYFFSSIAIAWQGLEIILNDVEMLLGNADIVPQNESTYTYGLADIRGAHELALDRIMFAFFLRKRQDKVARLLEDIFALVLQYADSTRTAGTSDLRSNFRAKVNLFIEACKDWKKTSDESRFGSTGVERLLLLLEMNGHYSGA